MVFVDPRLINISRTGRVKSLDRSVVYSWILLVLLTFFIFSAGDKLLLRYVANAGRFRTDENEINHPAQLDCEG